MNPRIVKVVPTPDYTLVLTFSNDETRIFDMTAYLEIGIFRELKDYSLFKTVKVLLGSVHWCNGQDLCPDTLYSESIPIGTHSTSIEQTK